MTELKVHASSDMIELMVQEDKVRKIFSARLAQACDKSGLDRHGRQAEIAKVLKVTPKAVSKWFNAESIPRRGKMAELCSFVGVSSEWLIGESDHDGFDDKASKRRESYRVDVLDVNASAGDGYLVSSEFIETIRAIEYTNDQARSLFGNRPAETVKVITVKGDSMSGTIESGDQIFLDMAVNFFDGDGIYVFVFGQTVHVKRLQMVKNTLLVLSDNKNYKEWSIEETDEEQFFVMAKVMLKQSVDYKRF
ncbi:TPA: XRE family transcriptional regulator [Yersinia enterocolitica]